MDEAGRDAVVLTLMTAIHAIDAGTDFAAQAADAIVVSINSHIADHGQCIIGLSGGGTPQPVYDALGQLNLNWSRIRLFLIDERYIAADHADSNQRMIRDTLLKTATLADEQICFPDTSLPLEDCVTDYANRLRQQWADRLPDLMILGMGPDGHIASLFPPVPDELMDDSRLVAHTTTDSFAVHDRITLTLNPITAAGTHIILLKGADKRLLWNEMLQSTEDERRWPMKRILERPEVTVIFGD